MENGRFMGGDGGVMDQGMKTGRFRGGDGWVYGSGGGDV